MPRIALPEVLQLSEGANLPYLNRAERQGTMLHSTPLTGADDVPGLNLLRGCVHRCAFCSVRAAPNYPNDDGITFYTNTAQRLAEELRGRPAPRAVFVSPATDPFPPFLEVQMEAARVVAVLAQNGVEAWLMTRGLIQPSVRNLLQEHRQRLKVTVPITTLSRELQDLLEPGAISPEERLEQIADLQRRGIQVKVALDPLVPTLTDTRDSMADLLGVLADLGVRQVSVSYLFLREGIVEQLREQLGERAASVLRAFEGGPVLSAPGLAAARYLPRARRQRGYATLMALAADMGLSVSVAALTNPDFAATKPALQAPRPSLRSMFLEGIAANGGV